MTGSSNSIVTSARLVGGMAPCAPWLCPCTTFKYGSGPTWVSSQVPPTARYENTQTTGMPVKPSGGTLNLMLSTHLVVDINEKLLSVPVINLHLMHQQSIGS